MTMLWPSKRTGYDVSALWLDQTEQFFIQLVSQVSTYWSQCSLRSRRFWGAGAESGGLRLLFVLVLFIAQIVNRDQGSVLGDKLHKQIAPSGQGF